MAAALQKIHFGRLPEPAHADVAKRTQQAVAFQAQQHVSGRFRIEACHRRNLGGGEVAIGLNGGECGQDRIRH